MAKGIYPGSLIQLKQRLVACAETLGLAPEHELHRDDFGMVVAVVEHHGYILTANRIGWVDLGKSWLWVGKP